MDSSQGPPEKGEGAEIVVKQNLGLSIGKFSDSGVDLHNAIAVFANAEGYRYLAEHFAWLATRKIVEIEADPGDHVHLTPKSDVCDEIDFTFDTITNQNRESLLANADATESSRLRGSPIKQFCTIVEKLVDRFQQFLQEDELQKTTIREINDLKNVLDIQLNRISGRDN